MLVTRPQGRREGRSKDRRTDGRTEAVWMDGRNGDWQLSTRCSAPLTPPAAVAAKTADDPHTETRSRPTRSQRSPIQEE